MTRLQTTIITILAAAFVSACKPRLDQSSVAAADTSSSLFDRWSYDRTKTVMIDQITKQNIKTRLSLFRLDLTDMASIGGRYDYSVSKVDGGEFRRIDRWLLTSAIDPGTLLVNATGQSLPVFIRLEAGRELEYSRVYDTKTAALTAVPKSLLDAPLTVANAARMSVGDAVSMPVRLGVRLGAQQGTNSGIIAGNIGASANAGVFWTGDCRLVIIKLDERHVRLKLMPSQSRGFFLAAQLGVSLDLFGYGPFGLINMDRQAERAIGLDLFRFNRELVVDGDKLAIDYAIDIADPVGAQIFESLVAKTLKLNPIALRKVDANDQKLGGLAFADLGPAESIHAADNALPAGQKRVTRLFKGSNAYLGDNGAMRIGTRFWRANSGRSLTLNWLTTSDPQGADRRNVYHLFHDNRGVNSLFSAVRNEYQLTAAALFAASPDWKDLHFADFTMSWKTDQRQLKPQEAADQQAELKAILGTYAKGLDLERIAPTKGAQRYSSRLTIVIPSALTDTMRTAGRKNPDLYERQLWLALWSIIPQLEGRLGAHSPGKAINLRAEMTNFLKRTTQSLRQLTRNALNMKWEGARGTTGQELVTAAQNLPDQDQFEFTTSVLKILSRDESAQEIVPAFFLALSQVFQITPHLAIKVQADDLETIELAIGEFSNQTLHDDVAASLDALSLDGFER